MLGPYSIFCGGRGIALFLSFAAMPTPAFAADVDVSKCRVAKVWQDAYNKGDAASVAALYPDDAIEVTPGGIRVGPAAVKQRVEEGIGRDGMKVVSINATKCDLSGGFKWSAGDWKGDTPQGPVGGFWTAIEVKDGDTWKMHNLTFSLTPPPPNK